VAWYKKWYKNKKSQQRWLSGTATIFFCVIGNCSAIPITQKALRYWGNEYYFCYSGFIFCHEIWGRYAKLKVSYQMSGSASGADIILYFEGGREREERKEMEPNLVTAIDLVSDHPVCDTGAAGECGGDG